MLYFIPAWYKQNKFRELEQCWYSRRMHTEFDDTVKQVQLFHRNAKMDYKILLLSYTPNFRHFLHRQGVFHAPYWSVFDSIQEVTKKKATVFSFRHLKWPEGIEFVYTPFVVLAYLNGVKYAKIEFGEDGNPIEVSMYTHGTLNRRNIYDDRGFVSSTEVYENDELVFTDYLTESGVVKFREYSPTGYIELNENTNYYLLSNGAGDGGEKRYFKQVYYNNISEMIREVFEAHLENSSDDDIFCAAMHEYNMKVMRDVLQDKKYILSFYGERFRVRDYSDAKAMVKNAGYIITDSEATTRYLNRDMEEEMEHIVDISPYDSRVDFGISQQLSVQKILVPIDDLPEDRFEMIIKQLAIYLGLNEMARVHLFTRNAEYDKPQRVLDRVSQILIEGGFDPRWTIQPDEKKKGENDIDRLEGEEEVPTLFFVEQCVDELSVSKCVREQRVLLDMRHNPDLYLQINCLSTAIPQIVRRQTQYVVEKENGLIIKDLTKIPQSLTYFLDGLKNWNNAKVYSYQLGLQFTTRKLLEKWDMVLSAWEREADGEN